MMMRPEGVRLIPTQPLHTVASRRSIWFFACCPRRPEVRSSWLPILPINSPIRERVQGAAPSLPPAAKTQSLIRSENRAARNRRSHVGVYRQLYENK